MSVGLHFAVPAPLEEKVRQEQQKGPQEDEGDEDGEEVCGAHGHRGAVPEGELACEAHVIPSAIQCQLLRRPILQGMPLAGFKSN